MPTLKTKIKYWFLVQFGMKRCSGYKVYPNGVKCSGCRDCIDNSSRGEEDAG
jgi:hypothetical protein